MDKQPDSFGTWKRRRKFLYAVSAFCCATILIALLHHMDAGVATTAITMAFGVLASNVGAYVFGAAWDDKNKMVHGGAKCDDKEAT